MPLIPDVINYLIGVSAVSAITTRIYRQQAPQATAYPYVIVARDTGNPTHHLSGTSSVRIDRVSITGFTAPTTGSGMAAADALGTVLQNALDNYRGAIGTTGTVSILLVEDPEAWFQPQDGSQRAAYAIEQVYQIEYPSITPDPTEE